jgi:hypothetical protein
MENLGYAYTVNITTDEPLPDRMLDEVRVAVTQTLGDVLRDTPVSYDVDDIATVPKERS